MIVLNDETDDEVVDEIFSYIDSSKLECLIH